MKTYNVLEILPLYLEGKKIKRVEWDEVKFIQFDLNYEYNKEYKNCSKTLKVVFNKSMNDTESKRVVDCYMSPLESIDRFGINHHLEEKRWIVVD